MATALRGRPALRRRPAGQGTGRRRRVPIPIRMARQAEAAGSHPPTRNLGFHHRALITLTLAGALIALAGPGTLASFNASTAASNAATSAVIILDNTQQS